jgi:hypothetical protein
MWCGMQDKAPADPDTWTPRQRALMEAYEQSATRNRYELRIIKWCVRQRISHQWVCLADVADWCAQPFGDIMPDEARRARAYQALAKSIVDGEFNKQARPVILLANGCAIMPTQPKLRLDSARLENWLKYQRPSEILMFCWAPREMCERWLAARGMKPLPWLNTTIDAVASNKAKPDQVPEQMPELRTASGQRIREAVRAVYDEAEKPPNINEVYRPVQDRLRAAGRRASKKAIQEIAGEQEFARRRLPVGVTLKSGRGVGK